MKFTDPKLILAAEGFTLPAGLADHAEAKAVKLRRHGTPSIGDLRIHVRLYSPHDGAAQFAVLATAETRGVDFVAHSSAAKPLAAINAAFVKLERAATAAAGVRKHNRHRTASVAGSPEGGSAKRR
ncbi:MAG: hypothetical protein RIQ93_548 [Verrucomicrobiota bacterium]|jgi:ribosome-associated translation inhibitor RaiA